MKFEIQIRNLLIEMNLLRKRVSVLEDEIFEDE